MKSAQISLRYVYICALFLSLGACSGPEPVATTYKKSAQAGGAAPATGTGSGNGIPATGTGTGTGTGTAPAANAAGDAAAGRTFFTAAANNCASCHGADGKGATPLTGLPYDEPAFAVAKDGSPAHASVWPTGTPLKNLLAFFATLAP